MIFGLIDLLVVGLLLNDNIIRGTYECKQELSRKNGSEGGNCLQSEACVQGKPVCKEEPVCEEKLVYKRRA